MWIETDAPAAEVAHALAPLGPPFQARLLQLGAERTRVVLRHPTARLRAAAGTDEHAVEVRVGPESYASVLRRAAARARIPLPPVPDLGDKAAAWNEAERLLAAGELERALPRYERLARLGAARDLAQLRIAHVYVASGHVREARARLEGLVRRLPRTPGAALARIWDHYLAVLAGDRSADPDVVEVAVLALDRSAYAPFVAFMAALVLDEIGSPARALAIGPTPEDLAAPYREAVARARRRFLLHALADAVFVGHVRDAAMIAEAYPDELAAHPDAARAGAWAVEAWLGLADGERAEALARRLLALGPAPDDEGRIVALLAWSEALGNDFPKFAAALAFLAGFHPDAPDLTDLVRVFAARSYTVRGYDATSTDLTRLAERAAGAPPVRAVVLGALADLAVAAGRAEYAASALGAVTRGGTAVPERTRQLAAALADSGRNADAVPLLRQTVAATTDPELRDALAFVLARAEIDIGRPDDGEAILADLAQHGTRWGTIARLALRERELQRLLSQAPPGAAPRSAP